MMLGSLAMVRLLTELLSHDAYGELALGMTIASLANQMVLGPLGGGINRFYAIAVEKGELGGYLRAVTKLIWYTTAIIIVFAVAATFGLAIFGMNHWISICVSSLVFATLSGNNSNLIGIQTAARRRDIVAILQGVEPFLRMIVFFLLTARLGTNGSVVMIAFALSALFLLVIQAFFLKKMIKGAQNSQYKKEWTAAIWRFSWPMGVFGIFTWFQMASDRWALQFFASTSEIGRYTVVYQLGYYPISFMTGVAMQFVVPILYQRAGDVKDGGRNAGVDNISWRMIWLSLAVTGCTFLAATLWHGPIFRILVAEEYRDVSYLMPWMIISGGLFSSGQMLAANLQAQLKTREMIVAKIATALSGLAMNLVGAYLNGITGVIFAGISYSIMYFFWMTMLVTKMSRNKCFP